MSSTLSCDNGKKGLGSPSRAGTDRKLVPFPRPVTNGITCALLQVLIIVRRENRIMLLLSLMHILSVSSYQQTAVQRSDPC